VPEHRVDVVTLARCPSVQVAAARLQLWQRFAWLGRPSALPPAQLDEVQLDVVDRNRQMRSG
jgi:hypothetical protein